MFASPSPTNSLAGIRAGGRLRALLLTLALFVPLALVASACSGSTPEAGADATAGESSDSAESGSADDALCAALDESLTSQGAEMFAQRERNGGAYPVYELTAEIDPASGTVQATMSARVPDRSPQLQFRAFAGVPSFDANLQITAVRVDGAEAAATLEQALVTVDNPSPDGDTDPLIEMAFSYLLQETAASSNLLEGLSGESLEPAKVGLLGRTSGGAQMGHWFPVWLPPSSRADATLDGFGDIGAFPAAGICVTLRAPSDYSVITGGVALEEAVTNDGWTTHVEGGLGLRDLALLLTNELTETSGEVDGVAVNVWGPAGEVDVNATALSHALVSQASLSEAFGPYPWTEIDLVSAPLGSGVGGMEWPGMVWIESDLFAGGIPGLGGLSDSGLLSGDIFDDLLEDLPGGNSLDSMLEWTIAHELGHEWWHAVVGNDSVESPAVDEPLAQFAACVAMRDLRPDTWREVCEAQTLDTYAQSRGLMGIADAPAEQASDAFDSSTQYGAIVYGKAPGFYFEAGDLLGWDVLESSLRSFIAAHPFELVGTEVLRSHLIESAADQGQAIADLWDRWFRGEFGDEDIGVAEGMAGLPDGTDLGDLLGDGGLDDLLGDGGLEDLFGDGGLEDLFGEGGLDDLLGEGGLEDLLGDLLGSETGG